MARQVLEAAVRRDVRQSGAIKFRLRGLEGLTAGQELGTPGIKSIQQTWEFVLRGVRQFLEQTATVAVDRDHQWSQVFDTQLHQAIVRDQIIPRHLDHGLDGVGMEGSAAAEE